MSTLRANHHNYMIFNSFFRASLTLQKHSRIEKKGAPVLGTEPKFHPGMKFFLDFSVDNLSLWRHLRHSQGAITGRLVYARV
jgi:hypothetical protein